VMFGAQDLVCLIVVSAILQCQRSGPDFHAVRRIVMCG
jgi:hypothetical protein